MRPLSCPIALPLALSVVFRKACNCWRLHGEVPATDAAPGGVS